MKSPTDPRTRGAAQALMVLLLGCHTRAVTGQPLDAPSVPLEAPLRVCESPAGRAALARLPGAAPCGQRAMNLVSVSLPVGPLDVLARAGDPGEYGFHWFDPRSDRPTQRRDRLERTDDGFLLLSNSSPESPVTRQVLGLSLIHISEPTRPY